MDRYDDALRVVLQANLDRHEVRRLPLDGRRHAAVAVVVVDSDPERHGVDLRPELGDVFKLAQANLGPEWTGSVEGTAGGAAFVITRRSPRIGSHAGQWALPGGRIDEGESVLDAARREVAEEVGLHLEPDALMGYLDDYATRSGYVITPVVLWGGGDPELVPCEREVASIHRIRLTELQREDSPRFITIPESDRPVVQVPIGKDLVHAPTGAVLLQFRRVAMEGVSERVDHLEQPVFAWS